ASRRGGPLGGPGGGRPQGRKEDRFARARQDRPTLPSLWGHDPRGLLRRFLAPVLPHVPNRRQAASRPTAVPPAQVGGTAPDNAHQIPLILRGLLPHWWPAARRVNRLAPADGRPQ